jgi:hypothetical protein
LIVDYTNDWSNRAETPAKHVGYADNNKPLEDCHQQSIKLRWPDLAGG